MKTAASGSIQYDNIFSPFSGKDWRKGFFWAKEQHFDAVELILSDPGSVDGDDIEEALEEFGLTVATISTGQAAAMEGLSMCSPKKYIREATWRRLKDDIDFSVRLGRPNVTIGLIRGCGGECAPETEYNIFLKELARAADYGEKRRVRLNLEPINRYECKIIHNTAEGAKLLQDLGLPENVGILYDTFHSNIEDANMISEIKKYASFISHVHLADSNRRLPGEGHINFQGILQALQDEGFCGYTSLEVLNTPSAAYIRENAGKRVSELYGGINVQGKF